MEGAFPSESTGGAVRRPMCGRGCNRPLEVGDFDDLLIVKWAGVCP